MTSVRRSAVTEASPFSLAKDGVRVAVRLRPGASRDAIEGLVSDADGQVRLAARVRAVPEKGKANAALTKLLARAWKVPIGSLSVVGGATGRNKTVAVVGEPDLLERLRQWGETR